MTLEEEARRNARGEFVCGLGFFMVVHADD